MTRQQRRAIKRRENKPKPATVNRTSTRPVYISEYGMRTKETSYNKVYDMLSNIATQVVV